MWDRPLQKMKNVYFDIVSSLCFIRKDYYVKLAQVQFFDKKTFTFLIE